MKFAEKIAKFGGSRLPWAILIVVSVGLVILAHSLFQNYVYMPPCEQCVYIRFAFLCMALGGLIAIVNPKNLLLALAGYLLAFWGAIQGIMYSVKLAKIHDAVHGDEPRGSLSGRLVPDPIKQIYVDGRLHADRLWRMLRRARCDVYLQNFNYQKSLNRSKFRPILLYSPHESLTRT